MLFNRHRYRSLSILIIICHDCTSGCTNCTNGYFGSVIFIRFLYFSDMLCFRTTFISIRNIFPITIGVKVHIKSAEVTKIGVSKRTTTISIFVIEITSLQILDHILGNFFHTAIYFRLHRNIDLTFHNTRRITDKIECIPQEIFIYGIHIIDCWYVAC